MKVAIFLNGEKKVCYDLEDYRGALEVLLHAYEVTGMPHELKFVDETPANNKYIPIHELYKVYKKIDEQWDKCAEYFHEPFYVGRAKGLDYASHLIEQLINKFEDE